MAIKTTLTVDFDGEVDPTLFQEWQDRFNDILEEAFDNELAELGIFDYEVTYETE